jgi:uncharacterized protein YjbJ (UPF0337 family)
MSEPDKTSGQFHSVKGNATEAVSHPYLICLPSLALLTCWSQLGNAIGSNDLQQSGQREHAEGMCALSNLSNIQQTSWSDLGEAETNAAKAKNFVSGLQDQATGYLKSVSGAVTGDKSQQASGMSQPEWVTLYLITDDLLGNVEKETGKAEKEANKPWSIDTTSNFNRM